MRLAPAALFLIPALVFALVFAQQNAQQPTRPFPALDDIAGFKPIFDGKTLNGWDGDPKYWRVENGAIVGEVTPATILKRNTFIIWRGGTTKDFELKVDYRITSKGNSGVNYRSVELTEPDLKLAMRGYQADIDGEERNANGVRYTGQNYEERGRTFLGLRGQIVRVDEGNKARIIGSLGDPKELESHIKSGDWNQYHLIARGNVLVHILNGHTMSVVIDEDTANRKFDGQLGVQVHVGPPMKVEFKNFLLKPL